MQQDLQHTSALLSRTPAAIDALLRGLPDAWTQQPEGEGTWTVFDVVAHLNHCERTDWMTRCHSILQHGETRVFAPLDRAAGAQQNKFKALDQLLDDFTHLRAENLETLRKLNLQPEDLARSGVHPAFGPVTLSQLLATWATHDLTHLHQISRIMAHQYRESVGPWVKYLGVLQCDGHSASA
jgi:hypothetical protein